MKYQWNKNIHILKGDNKFLFTNIDNQKWLRSSEIVKKKLDEIINENIKVDKLFHDKVVKRFINNGIIVDNDNINVKTIPSKSIKTVYFILTEKCNMECEFCYINSGPGVQEEIFLDTDKIKNTFDRLYSIGVDKVLLTGGEPLLRHNFIEIINSINPKISLLLQTNGLLLTTSLIDQFENKINSIEISMEHVFNSPNHKKHIMEKIEYLMKKNIKISFSFVATSENKEYITDFLDICAKYQAGISLKLVDLTGRANLNKHLKLNRKNTVDFYKKVYQYIYDKGYYNLDNFKSFLFPGIIPRYTCSASGKILAIFPDGRVYPCHSMRDNEFLLGSLSNDSIDNIIENNISKKDSDLYQSCFNTDRRNFCSNCDIRYYCNGRCGATMFTNGKFIEVGLPDDCDIRKSLISFILWDYKLHGLAKENIENLLKQMNSIDI